MRAFMLTDVNTRGLSRVENMFDSLYRLAADAVRRAAVMRRRLDEKEERGPSGELS